MYLFVAFVIGLKIQKHASTKNDFVKGQLHAITDDSDFEFRNRNNMSDSYVNRVHILNYSKKVKAERAKRERELQLDAFNYLHKQNVTDDNIE